MINMKQFIQELTKILQKTGGIAGTDALIEQLIAEEKHFIQLLTRNNRHKKIFEAFIKFLSHEKDIRSARSYFRERETEFKDGINEALRKSQYSKLLKYRYNFMFCQFAMQHYKNPPLILQECFSRIKELRHKLIHMYLHYCLNRARVFARFLSNINEFEDFLQAANEGLVVAVDKYVPEKNGSPFYTVAIGRMTANLIQLSTSSEIVYLGSAASRKLYKIRRFLEYMPHATPQDIAIALDVAVEEVISLLNLNSAVSLDMNLNSVQTPSESSVRLIDILPDFNQDLEHLLYVDQINRVKEVFLRHLSILEQKILRLKGIRL